MPNFPRGRRQKRPSPEAYRLAVPVVSPQRQVHEQRVLVKPHDWTRGAVAHRLKVDGGDPTYEQPWDDASAGPLQRACSEAANRLDLTVESAEPDADERLAWTISTLDAGLARTLAACASAAASDLWLTLAGERRLAVKAGKFWRRERGRLLHYKPAPDIHLPRDLRASVRDLLVVRSA